MENAPLDISVVCVFNVPEVRAGCLDQSIADYAGPVDVDYVPVDNTAHQFTSAGAALNHGASLARHDIVVFVHQDVYLHSIDRLAIAGRYLLGDSWGILGANGFTRTGQCVGRLRDRIQLIGNNADLPQPVDSLDEVLFMVRRDRVLAEPLTTDPDLAWHAYAVEYGLRMRERGLGVGAINLAVTHNSLTINLDRLDVAHRRIAALYPSCLPIYTTCGRIGDKPTTWRDAPVIRSRKWRLRWLTGSRTAARVRRIWDVPIVLADICLDVDRLDLRTNQVLHVVNLDPIGGFVEHVVDEIQLSRREVRVCFEVARDMNDAMSRVARVPDGESVVVTGLALDQLGDLSVSAARSKSWLIGIREHEPWVLGGSAAEEPPVEWSDIRAVPFRMPSWSRRMVAS